MDPGDENDAEPDTVEIVTADESVSAANGFGMWLHLRGLEESVGGTFRDESGQFRRELREIVGRLDEGREALRRVIQERAAGVTNAVHL